jgi:hypothetical protein
VRAWHAAGVELVAADVKRIPQTNLRIAREVFVAVWAEAERRPGWYCAGVAKTCRWVGHAPSRLANGTVWSTRSPVTGRTAMAHEESIEAEALAAEVLSLGRPAPAWLADRPGWLGGILATFDWCWRCSGRPPIDLPQR